MSRAAAVGRSRGLRGNRVLQAIVAAYAAIWVAAASAPKYRPDRVAGETVGAPPYTPPRPDPPRLLAARRAPPPAQPRRPHRPLLVRHAALVPALRARPARAAAEA